MLYQGPVGFLVSFQAATNKGMYVNNHEITLALLFGMKIFELSNGRFSSSSN
jgi:hypothetical protein